MRRARRIWLIFLLALVTSIIIVISFPELQDELSYWWASYVNTADSYSKYVASWPSGRHAQEAFMKCDEFRWADVSASGLIGDYQGYIDDNPQGRHVAAARESLDVKHWEVVKGRNTISSYQWYLDSVQDGRFRPQAESSIVAVSMDDDPYQTAKRVGSRQALDSFRIEYPGHRREKEVRAMLGDMAGRDITDLIAEGKIEARARGSGMDEVDIEIRPKVDYEIKVEVSIGTYFVCKGGAQNMVATRGASVRLTSDAWVTLEVSAACANREKDVPSSRDRFYIRRSPGQAELERLIRVLDSARASTEVRQAAVWIVTDNADYNDLGTLISQPAFVIYGGSRAINELEAARAMQLCDLAGIDITRKAIWTDRMRILKGLPDGPLQVWLDKKIMQ